MRASKGTIMVQWGYSEGTESFKYSTMRVQREYKRDTVEI